MSRRTADRQRAAAGCGEVRWRRRALGPHDRAAGPAPPVVDFPQRPWAHYRCSAAAARAYLRSMARDTFTARAARWSAAHRKTAVLGWLAFVVVAFAIGGAAGTVTLKQEDWATASRCAANQVLAQRVPDASARPSRCSSRAAAAGCWAASTAPPSTSSSRACRACRRWRAIESPLQRGNEGQRSKDGTAALVTFQITGDPDTAKDRVGARAGRDRRRAAGPSRPVRRRVRRRERQQGDHEAHPATTSSGPRSPRCR